MTVHLNGFPVALMLALAVAPSSALAQKSPEKIKLTAQSKDGAVLIRVPVQPFEYSLQFSRNGRSGFLSRVYQMNVRAGPPGYRYIARTLAPGRYRLDTVWQQGRWSACLEQGTIEFPVIAGQIAYLGTLQAEPILASIQRQAVERGRTAVAAGDIVMSRADDTSPMVDGRDDMAVDEARRFADAAMNGSGNLLRLAELNETAFSTSAAGRVIEICG